MLDDVESHVRWETPRGSYEAVQQQVFPQYETKVIEPVGRRRASTRCQQQCRLNAVDADLHTAQSKYFAPTKQEGCQSPRLAEYKGLNVWCRI